MQVLYYNYDYGNQLEKFVSMKIWDLFTYPYPVNTLHENKITMEYHIDTW